MKSLLRSPSDDEYVERVRRGLVIQRMFGAISVLVGLLFGAFMIWLLDDANPREMFAGDPLTQIAFEMGFDYGRVSALVGLCIPIWFINGVASLLMTRTSRLLIHYHDRLKELEDANTP